MRNVQKLVSWMWCVQSPTLPTMAPTTSRPQRFTCCSTRQKRKMTRLSGTTTTFCALTSAANVTGQCAKTSSTSQGQDWAGSHGPGMDWTFSLSLKLHLQFNAIGYSFSALTFAVHDMIEMTCVRRLRNSTVSWHMQINNVKFTTATFKGQCFYFNNS